MICDWLTNWECLFPEESSIKVDILGLDERRQENKKKLSENERLSSKSLTLRKTELDRKTSPARYLIYLPHKYNKKRIFLVFELPTLWQLVPPNHPSRQKKFRIDCVIPH